MLIERLHQMRAASSVLRGKSSLRAFSRTIFTARGAQVDAGMIPQRIHCHSALDIEAFGGDIAQYCDTGDLLLLKGGLGAGKTCFARGFIRALLQDENMFVTSPSYLLDNTYATPDNVIIHHMDLYRLPNKFDSSILGIPGIFNSSICLIEWPDRLHPSDLGAHLHRTVTVTLDIEPDETRVIEVEVHENR